MPTPTTLSFDPFQQAGGSGTANVPAGQSTGSQYQGADIADDLFFPQSGANPVTINSPIAFGSGATFFTPGVISGSPTAGQPATAFTIGGIASSSGVIYAGGSGGGAINVTVVGSGGGGAGTPYSPTGSGGTLIAGASGAFTPAGFFFIQVPTSGNPFVKIPFFNS